LWWCRAKWAAQSEPDRRDAPGQSSLRLSAGNPTGLPVPAGTAARSGGEFLPLMTLMTLI
jgi:hypothetical protein